jgi:hypothetical protein
MTCLPSIKLFVLTLSLAAIAADTEEFAGHDKAVDAKSASNAALIPLQPCRSWRRSPSGIYASGLVLVSQLAVEVQEDAPSGQIRVPVKNVAKESYVSEVQAKVIGSRDEDFVSGATDLRGVFVAQGVRGKSTLIAESDSGRYAFYRGQTELGPAPEPAKPAAAEQAPQDAKGAGAPAGGDKSGDGKPVGRPGQPAGGQQDNNGLLDNIQLGNGKIQQENPDSLNRIYQQNKGAVKANEAY